MRIVKESKNHKTYEVECSNHSCEAVIECELHELQYVPNSLRGQYHVMHCPCCGLKTVVDGLLEG